LVEGVGLLVLLQVEVAFCRGIVVDGAFVWGIAANVGYYLVEQFASLLVVPLIVVAKPHIGVNAVVERVFLVEFLKDDERLVIFAAVEILHGSPEELVLRHALGLRSNMVDSCQH
jgi:hypothetical protein